MIEEKKTSKIQESYTLEHGDISKAKKIEKYHDLFRLFITRDKQKITLCIAAVRTLLRETEGIFSREEMESTLDYLNSETKVYVIRTISKYGWITNNGVRYQIPERVRHMIMFFFNVFVDESDSFSREIAISLAVSDLDEVVGNDEQSTSQSLQIAFGTLKRIRMEFKNCVEQKSSSEARNLLMKGKDFNETMRNMDVKLNKINRNSYRYTQTTEVRKTMAEIMRLSQELHEFIQQDIQANARSFGQYLTPEQVEEFLHEAPLERLVGLIEENFSSPRKPSFLSQEELYRRGLGYLENKPEIQELTKAPPIIEIVERNFKEINSNSASNGFYEEIIYRSNEQSSIPLYALVIKNSFGETIFRTGLLTTLRNELKSDEEMIFEIKLKDNILELPDGFLKNITDGSIEFINNIKEDPKE